MNVKHNKEAVLKKGLRLFWSDGYSAVGVNKICQTTGMTKGAFYNAFKSKENFLLEGLSVYGEFTVEQLTNQLSYEPRKKKAINRLKDLYDYIFDRQAENNYIGCMVNNMMSELAAINQIVGEATSKEFNRFVETIEPCVQEAQEDGDLIENLDSKLLTELLHTTFFGALTRAKTLQDSSRGKETMALLIRLLSK